MNSAQSPSPLLPFSRNITLSYSQSFDTKTTIAMILRFKARHYFYTSISKKKKTIKKDFVRRTATRHCTIPNDPFAVACTSLLTVWYDVFKPVVKIFFELRSSSGTLKSTWKWPGTIKKRSHISKKKKYYHKQTHERYADRSRVSTWTTLLYSQREVEQKLNYTVSVLRISVENAKTITISNIWKKTLDYERLFGLSLPERK